MDALRRGVLSLVVVLSACGGGQHAPIGVAANTPTGANTPTAPKNVVDAARLSAADSDSANWLTHGRTYDEQRFSPLRQINPRTIGQLKLAWHYDLDAARRVQETTPLIVDGVMYVTSAWSKVFALDPATGKQLWAFDPAVPGSAGVKGCCDVANRGVAFWEGKVYVGTFDGRLIALDAQTGKQVWSVQTADPAMAYTITGAPRIIKGRVIIGNGGGEYIARGYVTAYDAQTGKQVWRFYTVPGEPGKPDGAASDEVLESKARSTWHGKFWTNGGGGTVWDSMAYDPRLDLLYIGTDNGSPWNRAVRSPGGGDNLFIASIIALRPDTGQYVWHFQESPGESWDFSATQHIMLADLQIDGKQRHVLMQAPKNGFFYLLDRETGAFIAARPFATVNWALSLDAHSGRPTENPQARYGETGKPWVSLPGPAGAHSWQPMSYSPLTGLVYLPVSEAAFVFIAQQTFKPNGFGWNTGVDFNAGSLPEDPKALAAIKTQLKGRLSAWNPVTQREVWRVQYDQPWNGGILATAGNLVFQGNSMGEFAAFQADDGKPVWSVKTYTGIVAPPVSYEIDGEQYIAVEVGWGGAFGLAAGVLAHDSQVNRGNVPRVLAFKLNGEDSLPVPAAAGRPPLPPPDTASAAVVARGKLHYHTYCGMCHGDSAVSGGVLPDLRHSGALGDLGAWQSVVRDGARQANGMVAFGGQMNKDEIEAIRAYVVHRANEEVAVQ
jgi:alcohol dehydrogenase (cytochrome c)/quinohemoprotein ethanol dehydrogenase